MEEKGEKLSFQNLLIYYFLCSTIGWILEMIYGYMVFGHFVDRGFLYGPMCPIYGCGAVMIVIIAETIGKRELNTAGKFLILMAIFTVLEYIASWLLEIIFNQRWWDYTGELLNINGRICLVFSLMFGLMGIIFIEKLYKPSKKLLNKIKENIPNKVIWCVLIILSILWFIDTVFSTIKYVNLSINLL